MEVGRLEREAPLHQLQEANSKQRCKRPDSKRIRHNSGIKKRRKKKGLWHNHIIIAVLENNRPEQAHSLVVAEVCNLSISHLTSMKSTPIRKLTIMTVYTHL